MTKKLLIQFDTDTNTSAFDAVVAYDAGIDHLIPYAGITVDNVQGLVHGAMFTRGDDALKNTAIFVGGSKVSDAEAILKQIDNTFFGSVRVSVMLDANGCNTTAAATVVCASQEAKLAGSRIVVLGSGPVGSRVTQLMCSEGASVVATDRTKEQAAEVCDRINRLSLSGTATPGAPQNAAETLALLDGADIVVACGPAGLKLIDSATLAAAKSLKVAIDLNAVPTAGIEGIGVTNEAKQVGHVVTYGAIGVGGLKMKTHRAAVASLFERNDVVLDAAEIFEIAKRI